VILHKTKQKTIIQKDNHTK